MEDFPRWFDMDGNRIDSAEANELLGSERRKIARTDLGDDVWVSTVFLVLDHNFSRHGGPPVLWETMVFGGPLDQEMWRYTSREDALRGHDAAVALARLDPE